LARDLDPGYGAAFDRARACGVEAIARRCVLSREGIVVGDAVPIVD
jgi:sugar fermentation stimulation protein A